MNDNETIKQLSDALNQLLEAYEASQKENGELKVKIDELEGKIVDLEDQIEQLSNTTKTHSSEMDNMLNRISSILNDKVDKPSALTVQLGDKKDEIPTIEESQIQESIQAPITVGEQLEEVMSSKLEDQEEIKTEEEENIDEISEVIANSIVEEVEKEEVIQKESKDKIANSKPLDLGRMQSLLNGMQ
jgi:transcriptional regulator with GAF, ATPase, and Fis domain